MLIADLREPESMRRDCDAVYDLKRTCGVGDYLIQVICSDGTEKKLLFERKTAADFMHTTHMDGRLNDQLDGVDGLMFEKMFVPRRTSAWWISLYSTLNGVAHHHPVFFTLSSKHTIRQLRNFEEKLQKGEWGTMRKCVVLPPISKKENEDQVRCLMGLPGMGEKRANDILLHYKRLDVALASVDNWSKDVRGIGPKTAQSVKYALTKEVV